MKILDTSILTRLGNSATQLGLSTRRLVVTSWKAPFTGGWKRTVVLLPPVVFVSSAVGAAIFHMTLAIIQGLGNQVRNGFASDKPDPLLALISQYSPANPQNTSSSSGSSGSGSSGQSSSSSSSAAASSSSSVNNPQPPSPLAGENRNETFKDLLKAIDAFIVDPTMAQIDASDGNTGFLLGILNASPEFKELCKNKEISKPCLRSIALTVLCEAWDASESSFIEQFLKNPKDNGAIKKARGAFARIMRHGALPIANTVFSAFPNTGTAASSSSSAASSSSQPASSSQNAQPENENAIIDAVWGELEEKYLKDLLDKKLSLNGNSSGAAGKFVRGEISEEAFLSHEEAQTLTTSQLSRLAQKRAAVHMLKGKENLRNSILKISKDLVDQLKPVLNDALETVHSKVSAIPLQEVFPRIVTRVVQLLRCCKTMQERKKTPFSQEEAPLLKTALERSGIPSDEAVRIGTIYKLTPKHLDGMSILPDSAYSHDYVRHKQEADWVEKTLPRLKGLFHTPGPGPLNTLIEKISFLRENMVKIAGLEAAPGLEWLNKLRLLDNSPMTQNMIIEQLNEITSTSYISKTITTAMIKKLVQLPRNASGGWDYDSFIIAQKAYVLLDSEQRKELKKQIPSSCFEDISEIELSIGVQYEAQLDKDLKTIQEAINTATSAEKVDLRKAYAHIERERDLRRFARAKDLFMQIVVSKWLDETLALKQDPNSYRLTNLAKGGAEYLAIKPLKETATRIIEEAFTLLSFQEVLKHFIISMVNFLLDALDENGDHDEAFTVLDGLSDPDVKKLLLDEVFELVGVNSKKVEGKVKDSLISGVSWLRNPLWDRLLIPFLQGKADKTSEQLADMLASQITEFGTDTENGLSSLLLQQLLPKEDQTPSPDSSAASSSSSS